MPLYRKPDFWNPNTNYISTDRYKSVIIHNNQNYICNTSHLSDTSFNQNYFTLLGGGGSALTSEDWDINSTTIVSPPDQVPVQLNDLIDSTFSNVNDTYSIIANNPLTLYEVSGTYFFGGFKYNIDEILEDNLLNEYKEIIVKDFHLDTNDYINLVFTSNNKEDFLTNIGNMQQNALSIIVYGFSGNNNNLALQFTDTNNTIVNTGVTFSGSGDLSFRISKNAITVLLNNTLVFNHTSNIEDWQVTLNNTINMALISGQVPSFVDRNIIEYTMPFPFTVTESVVVVNPPEDATDGKLYKLISNGTYNGNILRVDDYVIFQNNLQELVLVHDHNKRIPALELDSFKNKVYERGIIDDILPTLPINLNSFPNYYTFWTLDDRKLNAIDENKERVIIDVLDNTFKIGSSGLILERNNTGMALLIPYIDIIDTNYDNITAMMPALNDLGLQISEENYYQQRLKKYNLDADNPYQEIYLADTIGNIEVNINDSFTTGTLVIRIDNYNQLTFPAYQSLKNTKIVIINRAVEDKIVTINGIAINGISDNNLKIKSGNSIILDINENYNINNDPFYFSISCNILNDDYVVKDFYAVSDTTFNYHIKNIFINSDSPIININGNCFSLVPYIYNIYNFGISTTVNITINSELFSFVMNQYDKKELIINQTPPLGFQSGVFS